MTEYQIRHIGQITQYTHLTQDLFDRVKTCEIDKISICKENKSLIFYLQSKNSRPETLITIPDKFIKKFYDYPCLFCQTLYDHETKQNKIIDALTLDEFYNHLLNEFEYFFNKYTHNILQ